MYEHHVDAVLHYADGPQLILQLLPTSCSYEHRITHNLYHEGNMTMHEFILIIIGSGIKNKS